jgi:hypothetical protein
VSPGWELGLEHGTGRFVASHEPAVSTLVDADNMSAELTTGSRWNPSKASPFHGGSFSPGTLSVVPSQSSRSVAALFDREANRVEWRQIVIAENEKSRRGEPPH